MTRLTVDWKGPNDGVPFKLTLYLKESKSEAQLKDIFAERFNLQFHKKLSTKDVAFVDHTFQRISFDDIQFSGSLFLYACDPTQGIRMYNKFQPRSVIKPEAPQTDPSELIQSLQFRIQQLESENEKYKNIETKLTETTLKLEKTLLENKQIQEKLENAIKAKTQERISKSQLLQEIEQLKNLLEGKQATEEQESASAKLDEIQSQFEESERQRIEFEESERRREEEEQRKREEEEKRQREEEEKRQREEEQRKEESRKSTFNSIIKEIIDTESAYIDDLTTLNDTVTQQDLQPIFSNVNDLFNINKLLLKELKEMKDAQSQIGEIFMRYSDYLKIYTNYCSNQEMQMKELEKLVKKNKNVEKYLKEAKKNPKCRQLPIDSFLFLPIQRLCKYPLLIRELVKVCDDNKTLTEAAEKINNVVNTINDRKKTSENQQKIIEIAELIEGLPFELIQPARRLIQSGTLGKISNEKQQERQFYLFNDILIYAKPSLLNKKLLFRGQVEIGGALVEDLPKDDRFLLIRKDRKRTSYTLVCKSNEDKVKWMTNIQDYIVKKHDSFLVKKPNEPLVAQKPLPEIPTEEISEIPNQESEIPEEVSIVIKPRLVDSPGGGRMSMVGNILIGWVSKLVDLAQKRKQEDDEEFDSMLRVIQGTLGKLKKDVSREKEVKVVEEEVEKLVELAKKIVISKEVTLTSEVVQMLRSCKIAVENSVKNM